MCEEDEKDIQLEPVANEPGFVWSNIGGTKIIIRKSDKFVNISKLCSRRKQYSAWQKTDKAKELIVMVEKTINKFPIDLSRSKCGSMLTRGTYVHIDLLPPIALWISSDLYLKIILFLTKKTKQYFEIVSQKKIQNKSQNQNEIIKGNMSFEDLIKCTKEYSIGFEKKRKQFQSSINRIIRSAKDFPIFVILFFIFFA